MELDREFVLTYLNGKQIGQGGYYGTDLSDLAKDLIYLGESPPSITLDEFIEIKGKIQSNPLEFWTEKEKSNFVRDPPLVNAINQGNRDIAKLKAIDRIVEYIYGHETDTLKRLLFYGFRSHEQTFLYKRKLY